jgi:hypothetical protein
MRRSASSAPHESNGKCGAKTRGGSACSFIAGYKTDHPGQGRCHLHGGATPIKHGRYSTIKRPEIRQLIEEFEADDNPLNIFPELAIARAMLKDYIERYDEWREAIIGWHLSWGAAKKPLPEDKLMAFEAVVEEWEHESYTQAEDGELTEKQKTDLEQARAFIALLRGDLNEQRPRQVLDISDAVRHADTITKIVERIEKIRSSGFTYEQIKRFLFEVDRVLAARITDVALLEQMRDEILAIRV